MRIAKLRVTKFLFAVVSIANVLLLVWQFSPHVISGMTLSTPATNVEPQADLRQHAGPSISKEKVPNFQSKSEGQRLSCVKNSQHKKRVLFFFGTRPEINKMAPVIKTFRMTSNSTFTTLAIFTGQHQDLIKPFELFWNVSADFHLRGTMQKQQTLTALTGRLFGAIEDNIQPCDNDVWVVQGP